MCFIKFWTTFIFSKKKNSKIFLCQKVTFFWNFFFFSENFYTVMCFIKFWTTFIFSKKIFSRKVSKIFFRSCRTTFSSKNEMFVYTLWISSPILGFSDLLGGKILAIYWLPDFQNWAWPIWAWSMSRILVDQFLCFY